ncbi:MAG: Crp/Fnr family transcriptional regulator [Acidimicrobiales bacterium]
MADYLEHLAKVSLFAGADHKELVEISKATTEHTVDAGTVLVRQGETGREAFIVVEGEATVSVDGKEVAHLGPGDTIGEMSLLDKGLRSATVTADTPMRLLVLDPREFKGLMMAIPAIAVKVATALAARVRELDTKLYG